MPRLARKRLEPRFYIPFLLLLAFFLGYYLIGYTLLFLLYALQPSIVLIADYRRARLKRFGAMRDLFFRFFVSSLDYFAKMIIRLRLPRRARGAGRA